MKHPIKIAITGKKLLLESLRSQKLLKNLAFQFLNQIKRFINFLEIKNKKKKLRIFFFEKIDNLIEKDGSINKGLLGDYVFLKKMS